MASNEDEVHSHLDSALGTVASGPGFATVDNDSASRPASPKELELLECAVRPKQEYPTATLLGSEYQTQVQDYLRRLGQSRRHGLQNCIRSESKDSSAIGKTDWYPDEHNTNLVSSALDQTQLSDFPTAWERGRYVRRHRTWYSNLTALQGNIASEDHSGMPNRKLGTPADLFTKIVGSGRLSTASGPQDGNHRQTARGLGRSSG